MFPIEKFDARSLGDDALYQLRLMVVRLHQQALSRRDIAAATGLSYSAVSKITRLFEREGMEAMKPIKRGRRMGRLRRLDAAQEQDCRQTMLGGAPGHWGLAAALWNRSALITLVEQRHGITLPLRTASHYRDRWGFAPPDWQRMTEQGRLLQDRRFLALKAHAGATRAAIYWFSQRPLEGEAVLLSATSGSGTTRWLALPREPDGAALRAFAEALLADVGRKVILIVPDGAFGGEALERWLRDHDRLQCYRLPDFDGPSPPGSVAPLSATWPGWNRQRAE